VPVRPYSEDGSPSLADFDEAQLITRLRDRDVEALGELYREFGGAMLTLARSMVRNREEADDLVEEALLRIHDAAPRFRGGRGLKTWTLRIVANLCRDALRRRRFVAASLDDPAGTVGAGLAIDPVPDWDDALDRPRMLAALERALGEVSPEHREVLVLRERLGLSYEELAETLRVNVGTVRSRLSRAREALRGRLRPLIEGMEAG
jgi:RNA polymerase sigma-70 factor (ECF subfamily)